jgi:hypothetical protein
VSFVVDEEDATWRRICIDGDIVSLEDCAVINLKVCTGLEVGDKVLSLFIRGF